LFGEYRLNEKMILTIEIVNYTFSPKHVGNLSVEITYIPKDDPYVNVISLNEFHYEIVEIAPFGRKVLTFEFFMPYHATYDIYIGGDMERRITFFVP